MIYLLLFIIKKNLHLKVAINSGFIIVTLISSGLDFTKTLYFYFIKVKKVGLKTVNLLTSKVDTLGLSLLASFDKELFF